MLKLSGEALMGKLEFGTDAQEVERIARQIGIIRDRGVEVAIVVGAGNIYRGVDGAAQGMDRATGDYMGMLATLLNALTLQDVLKSTATSPRWFRRSTSRKSPSPTFAVGRCATSRRAGS